MKLTLFVIFLLASIPTKKPETFPVELYFYWEEGILHATDAAFGLTKYKRIELINELYKNKPMEEAEKLKHVKRVILKLVEQKKKVSIIPSVALDMEIFEIMKKQGYEISETKKLINELVKLKEIGYHRSINNFCFKPLKSNENGKTRS